jgi:DNA-binding NtrC family response regulator
MAQHILIVDDEPLIGKSLRQVLTRRGYRVTVAASAAEARAAFVPGEFSLALLDLRLPDGTGIELLQEFHEAQDDLLAILMTAFGSVESAVEAMRLGAYDYVNKPFKSHEIEVIVRLALETGDLKREVRELRQDATGQYGLHRLKSEDPAMTKVFDMVRKVVTTPVEIPVLIRGESGTGKEMVARAIHAESDRHDRPFVAINCAAIPDHLLESELFGHEKGAFTDAKARKVGLLERAAGGTVFLDEIGDMDLALQAKLLRVLEHRTVRRIGGAEQIPLDVRIVSATNASLERAIAEGRFREDVYYRLKLINIALPPLRRRRDDVLPLAEHFIAEANRRFHKQVQGVSEEAGRLLREYPWPGNVRELKNTVERILILEDCSIIEPAHLPPEILHGAEAPEEGLRLPGPEEIRAGVHYDGVLDRVGRHLIREALRLAGGNKAQAARLLSMDRGTLRYNIKRMGLEG